MRRFGALGWIALAALLVAAGCGKNDSEKAGRAADRSADEPTTGGTVFRHLEQDCKTLNWVLYTTVSEDYVLRLLYDYLLDYNEKLEIVPVLAESYEVSDDHLRIRVKLRDGLRWHDGRPITADDVKFTVDKIRDPGIPALNKRGWFNKLDTLEVVDDRTVVFVWKEPYAPAFHALAQIAPIPRHVYGTGDFLENPANRSPVGDGPFRFEDWQTGQSITLARNEGYHGKKAYLDRVVFRIIPDQAVALNALKTGEIDEMQVQQTQWEKQTNDPDFIGRFEKIHYYVPRYNYIAWNCRSAFFGDQRVRRAMTLLYDREGINAKLYSGFAEPVSGPFYINSRAYDQSIAPLPYDPARAKELLDEAGWKDGDGDGIREKDGVEFAFDLTISTSRVSMDLAQLLQEACRPAGIEVRIRQFDGATFMDRTLGKGEYVAALLAWRLDHDPDIFETFHSSAVPPAGLNHGFYKNPAVDSLLELGRTEFDPDRRYAIYHRVHRLIHEDQPYTFINTVPEKRVINKRIGKVVLSPDGPFRFYPGANYWYVKTDVAGAGP